MYDQLFQDLSYYSDNTELVITLIDTLIVITGDFLCIFIIDNCVWDERRKFPEKTDNLNFFCYYNSKYYKRGMAHACKYKHTDNLRQWIFGYDLENLA